ncbi:MAG: glycosyltransferase family 9 protein [candidate division Zixibacteria bacterium]
MIGPKKALMIQLRRIGDVLMCTPAIRAFKKRHPDCRLDFLTELPDVLSGNPHLNNIIPVDRSRQYDPFYQYSLIRKIRRGRYNLVVDFFANPRSAYYSFLSGAGTRLSYGYGHRRWAYNLVPAKSDEPAYAAQDRLNLLEKIDISSDDCRLEFYPDKKDRETGAELLEKLTDKPIATISPVSRRAFNRWPLERYAELAKRLSDKFDYQIVIMVGPGEEDVAEKLGQLTTAFKPHIYRIERLGHLGAIFERAEIHIGNDNGPKHIAVASDTPTFTIFGPHSHISWTYPDYDRHRYIRPADIDSACRTPGHVCGDRCVLKIPIDVVWERISSIITEIKTGKSSVKTP